MILKISLQPLGKFFFGGEAGFNEAGREEDRRTTYVLHSRYYPQQTGVLGLIRNQLLLQNGLLWDNSARVSDKTAAKTLIGGHGFKVGYKSNFGVIQKIGPVYLESADGSLCPPAPLDDVLMKDKNESPVPMVFAREHNHSLLRHYNEKAGLDDAIQHLTSPSVVLEEAFEPIEQVGITKAVRPNGVPLEDKEDESGYYYQTFLKFRKPDDKNKLPFGVQRFSFYVEMSEDQPYKLESGIVEFGGERSTFQMTVEQTKLQKMPLPVVSYRHTTDEKGVTVKRLVCLSPSYVDMSKLKPLAWLIVSKSLSFRFFQTSTEDTENHQKISRDNSDKSLMESKLFQLLDRGSVIYFDPNNEKTISNLFEHIDFQNIGYNQFTIL